MCPFFSKLESYSGHCIIKLFLPNNFAVKDGYCHSMKYEQCKAYQTFSEIRSSLDKPPALERIFPSKHPEISGII